MKRSEMVVKMAQYYGIKHIMVEQDYVSPLDFCSSMLELIENIGMLPPFSSKAAAKSDYIDAAGYEWDEE